MRKLIAYALAAALTFTVPLGAAAQPALAVEPETKTVEKTSAAVTSPKLDAKSAIVMDIETGDIVFGKRVNKKRCIASTTKIMTAILAIENKSLSSKVTITKSAVNTDYSNLADDAAGDKILMKDLLYMALLPSDNGAATALGIHVAGSSKKFVKMMNAKAKELGCKNTRFKNAHGLNDNVSPYSTAKDLAVITSYAFQNKTFRKIVKRKSYSFKSLKHGTKYKVSSTVSIQGYRGEFLGGKTGYTHAAGCCFAGAFAKDKKRYVVVVLGSSSGEERWSDVKKLVKYGIKYA